MNEFTVGYEDGRRGLPNKVSGKRREALAGGKRHIQTEDDKDYMLGYSAGLIDREGDL